MVPPKILINKQLFGKLHWQPFKKKLIFEGKPEISNEKHDIILKPDVTLLKAF
jgi:hypothetical protein